MPLPIDDVAENNSDGCRRAEYNECQSIDDISSCCLRQQGFAVVLYYEARRIMLPSYDENTETRASLLEALQENPQTPTNINSHIQLIRYFSLLSSESASCYSVASRISLLCR